jgi:hypothetical protein
MKMMDNFYDKSCENVYIFIHEMSFKYKLLNDLHFWRFNFENNSEKMNTINSLLVFFIVFMALHLVIINVNYLVG